MSTRTKCAACERLAMPGSEFCRNRRCQGSRRSVAPEACERQEARKLAVARAAADRLNARLRRETAENRRWHNLRRIRNAEVRDQLLAAAERDASPELAELIAEQKKERNYVWQGQSLDAVVDEYGHTFGDIFSNSGSYRGDHRWFDPTGDAACFLVEFEERMVDEQDDAVLVPKSEHIELISWEGEPVAPTNALGGSDEAMRGRGKRTNAQKKMIARGRRPSGKSKAAA